MIKTKQTPDFGKTHAALKLKALVSNTNDAYIKKCVINIIEYFSRGAKVVYNIDEKDMFCSFYKMWLDVNINRIETFLPDGVIKNHTRSTIMGKARMLYRQKFVVNKWVGKRTIKEYINASLKHDEMYQKVRNEF